MGQQTRLFREASQTITAFNQKLIIPLQKGMILREMIMRLSGTFTIAAGDNLAASQGRGDEWSIFDRIDLVANGSDVIRSMSGVGLRMMNRMVYKTFPRTSPFMGAAGANPTFDSTCILPLWSPDTWNSMDTALDTSKLSDLRLELSIGPGSNVQSAGAFASAISATLDIWSRESFGVSGPFSGSQIFPLQSPTIAAGAGTYDFLLPVTGVYKSFLINYAATASPAAADVPVTKNRFGETAANLLTNIGINHIQLLSGTQTFVDVHPRALQDWFDLRNNKVRERTVNAAQTGAISFTDPTFQNLSRSALLIEDAWLNLDLVDDGFVTEAIDTVGLSELRLRVGFNGDNIGGVVTVWPLIWYPIRGK